MRAGRVARWSLAATVVALVPLLAGCSDAPSAAEVAAAVTKVQAAPEPAGTSPVAELPTNVLDGTQVPGTDVFRTELCSDGACPAFTRFFSTLRYSTMDEACAALAAYATDIGGEPPAGCPPTAVASAVSSNGNGPGFREDSAQVIAKESDVADFVVFKLAYATSAGEWDGTPVELTLGVGVQLGSP